MTIVGVIVTVGEEKVSRDEAAIKFVIIIINIVIIMCYSFKPVISVVYVVVVFISSGLGVG